MDEQKTGSEGSCGCGKGAGCGCGTKSCGCGGRVACKMFAGVVLLLLGWIVGFLMGTHGCHHHMGMMSCPYTAMPTPPVPMK